MESYGKSDVRIWKDLYVYFIGISVNWEYSYNSIIAVKFTASF